jgi:hypothetical protein
MKKIVLSLLILAVSEVSFADDSLLKDPQLMAQAKSAYSLDREQELRCAALGLDNVRKIALYRLVSRRLEGELADIKESNKTKIPSLERARVSQPNSSVRDLKNELEIFAQPELVKFIQAMSDVVYDRMGQPLQVTGTTKNSSHEKDLHCTHAHGLSVDFRPMPGTQPTTWKDDPAKYDREMNKNVIKFLIASPEVRRVFFNDPNIFDDPEVKDLIAKRKHTDPSFDYRPLTYMYATPSGETKTVQHDNHLHVELKGDPQIWQKANRLYKHFSAAK